MLRRHHHRWPCEHRLHSPPFSVPLPTPRFQCLECGRQSSSRLAQRLVAAAKPGPVSFWLWHRPGSLKQGTCSSPDCEPHRRAASPAAVWSVLRSQGERTACFRLPLQAAQSDCCQLATTDRLQGLEPGRSRTSKSNRSWEGIFRKLLVTSSATLGRAVVDTF